MPVNVNQLIDAIANHVPVFLIVVGILFAVLAVFDISIKPPAIQVTNEINNVRKTILGISIFIFLTGGVFLIFPFVPYYSYPTRLPAGYTATATTAPAEPTATAITTPIVISQPASSTPGLLPSSLIPDGQQPVINDPLKDNSEGYQWDTDSSSSGTCSFVQGYYLLSSTAGSAGIGCNTESSNSIFSNFVYQIQMTMLVGMDNTQAEAGPIFRVNTAGTGQQYQMTFNDQGDWDISTDVGDLSGGSCANPCPYFHKGLNQSNIITIKASGNSIQVQINGYLLGSYTDSTYSSGYIGVQITPGTENGSVAFSNVRVWAL